MCSHLTVWDAIILGRAHLAFSCVTEIMNTLLKPTLKGLLLTGIISCLGAGLFMTETPGLAADKPSSDSRTSTLASLAIDPGRNAVIDGAEFFQSMADAAAKVQAYSVRSEMTLLKDGKSIEENGKFFFKKPHLIRAEELGPYKKGALAILGKDGKIHGHLGGLLSKINGTVDAKSSWATSANGYPLADSDFYSMSQVMLRYLKSGKKGLVTEHPVKVTGQPKDVYIIELYSDSSQKELMKRAYVDPQNLLPVEWFDYKDGKLFAHTNWRALDTTTALNDSLFDL